MESKIAKTLLLLAVLATLSTCVNWQAADNMTGYLAPIRGFFDAAMADGLSVINAEIAINISEECNARWDRFWNVYYALQRDASNSVILYGYAFRRHWYWHNNYDGGKSFIVWKDYICQTEDKIFISSTQVQYNLQGDPNIKPSMTSAYSDIGSDRTDIWMWAATAMQDYYKPTVASLLSTDPSYIGVSGVFMNEMPFQFAIKVCLSDSGLGYSFSSTPTQFGAILFYRINAPSA